MTDGRSIQGGPIIVSCRERDSGCRITTTYYDFLGRLMTPTDVYGVGRLRSDHSRGYSETKASGNFAKCSGIRRRVA